MKTIKLNTGVIITQDDRGVIISVSSPYWSDNSWKTFWQKLKNFIK